MSRKRILYVENSTRGTIGGSHHSLRYLVEALDKKSFEPIVVFYERNSMIPEFEKAGADVRVLPPRKSFRLLPPGTGSGGMLAIRKHINSLARFLVNGLLPTFKRVLFITTNRIDLVHLNNNPFSGDWVIGSRLSFRPCVAHMRGLRRDLDWFHRYLARTASRVICISGAVHNSLECCGCDTGNFSIVHNGIDPDLLRPTEKPETMKAEMGMPSDAVVIGMVGNIKRWKGQHILIEAVSALIQKHPKLALVFVGAVSSNNQAYSRELQRQVDEKPGSLPVTFTGYTNQVANYIAVMDLVVHASVDPEPFGRVIIEAMAMAKPVVGSRDGGVLEIIDEPDCGRTFLPGDADDLADKIDWVLSDPERMAEMGRAAERRVNDHFHISANARKTMDIYKDLLDIPG